MARDWHLPRCLVAALLLLALQPCAACSDVLVACGRYAQAPASARTFDWTSSSNINYSVNLSPPGHQYTAGVVAAGVPARAFTWKHGFAGLNILNSAFVVDGLNDAGLSAAYLWQESAMLISNYTTDGPEFALAADDLLAYILGTFSDVDEAVEFMSSGTFQLVTGAPGSAVGAMLAAEGVSSDVVPAHLSLRDAGGNSFLVQFGSSVEDWKFYPGADVITNENTYEENLGYVAAWLNHTADPCWDTPWPYDPAVLNMPAQFFTQERFVRLTLLLLGACEYGGDHPRGQSWSPDATEAQEAAGIPAIATVQSLLRSVTIPWGAKSTALDVGLASNTEVTILRAHKQGLYMFQSPGNPQWQGFDLSKPATWAHLNGSIHTVPLNSGVDTWWHNLIPTGASK